MPEYRRRFVAGGTFFFTVVTNFRRPILTDRATLKSLRCAFDQTRAAHPFNVDAMVVLPDHLHCLWTLPPDDADFATRWRLIKTRFTRAYLKTGGLETGRSGSRRRQSERGVWQRRFWEHTVRDEPEFEAFANYIHFNPVKHGHASCPHAWAHSTFHRFVRDGFYATDWCCSCDARPAKIPAFHAIDNITGE